nr:hypothetical protein [Candidatus Erwinia dacicola]
MNVRTNYPFDAVAVRRFKYENAVFVVFLTGKPFFRHTDLAQASAAIVFFPFHATFPTVIPSSVFLPERRQNAAARRTGYIYTDPCPGSPLSAQRIPASPAFSGTVAKILMN